MRPWILFLLLAGCAKSMAPLPGDSISADGGVTLSPPRAGTKEAPGAIESRLFPAELIMENQIAIALTAEQKEAIAKEVERGQNEMSRLQWDLQKEKEALVLVLDAERPDEAKVAEAAERVMQKETRVKAAHLALLVRVKGQLTGAQQKKLKELRDGCRP